MYLQKKWLKLWTLVVNLIFLTLLLAWECPPCSVSSRREELECVVSDSRKHRWCSASSSSLSCWPRVEHLLYEANVSFVFSCCNSDPSCLMSLAGSAELAEERTPAACLRCLRCHHHTETRRRSCARPRSPWTATWGWWGDWCEVACPRRRTSTSSTTTYHSSWWWCSPEWRIVWTEAVIMTRGRPLLGPRMVAAAASDWSTMIRGEYDWSITAAELYNIIFQWLNKEIIY